MAEDMTPEQEKFKVDTIESILSGKELLAVSLNRAHSEYYNKSKVKGRLRGPYVREMQREFPIFKHNPDYLEEKEFSSEAVRWAHAALFLCDITLKLVSKEDQEKVFDLVHSIMPIKPKQDNVSRRRNMNGAGSALPRVGTVKQNDARNGAVGCSIPFKGGRHNVPHMSM